MNKNIKDKYIYFLYGIKLFSNIKLDFLPEYYEEDYFDLLNVNIDFLNIKEEFTGNIDYYKKDNNLVLVLGNYAQYCFFDDFLTLNVTCKDYDYLAATFLNLPFTIYFIFSNKGLLLHCASAYFSDTLYAFCAPKGTGKSTLLFNLINSNDFSFYNDDTLAIRIINNNIVFSTGSGMIKLNNDVNYDDLSKYKTMKNKYAEKNFYAILNKEDIKKINKLKIRKFKVFFLNRMNNSNFTLQLLNDVFTIKFLLMSNIVGTGVFNFEFQKKVCESNSFRYLEDNLSFSIVNIDNDISKINEITKKIIYKTK